jgi:hypothetical protein
MPANSSPIRTIRAAGYLAILFGIAGLLAGLAGAGTFIPYRDASTFNGQFAGVLTAIAAVGAIASLFGVVSGWSLLRTRPWAWNWTVGAAAACVALVAAMTAVWPASWGFLVVVAVAYALEVVLLWQGHDSYLGRTAGAFAG